MKLIKQHGKKDCAAACLAMVFGMKEARQAYPLIGYDPNNNDMEGVTELEVLDILATMGRAYHFQFAKESLSEPPAFTHRRLRIPSRHQLQIKLAAQQKGCAIVIVPSTLNEDALHFVVCYRGEVYDPSNVKEYRCTAKALPVMAAIFIGEPNNVPLHYFGSEAVVHGLGDKECVLHVGEEMAPGSQSEQSSGCGEDGRDQCGVQRSEAGEVT